MTKEKQAMPTEVVTDQNNLEGKAATVASDDPFDLTKLRLKQDFVETAGVKRVYMTVPVGKPGAQDFIRVHSDPAYRASLAVIVLREDRDETYLLLPDIARELP